MELHQAINNSVRLKLGVLDGDRCDGACDMAVHPSTTECYVND